MLARKIRVLIADDSSVARMLLSRILESDPQIQVVGAVDDGRAAVDFVARQKPDVVVMDIHMPFLDGFEATRRIMETDPLPIVICTASTSNARETAISFRFMEAGAVACVEKPAGEGHPDYEASVKNLIQTVKLMSEVRVVRRWPRSRVPNSSPPTPAEPSSARSPAVVGIGASTGGPPVIQTILAGLPKDFPLGILVVQHIVGGFLPGLVEWLNQTTPLQVQIAAHGVMPLRGHVYFAPDDFHMSLTPNGHIQLSAGKPENGLRPAVSHLFRSLAESCREAAAGVLLTGMGKDGAAELKLMKDQGATTIAQDRESSIVHGMPGEAIELGGATHVLAPDAIPEILITFANRRRAATL